MRTVKVSLAGTSYQVHIGSGILSRVGLWLQDSLTADRLVIITSPPIKQLYGDDLAESLKRDGFKITTLLVPDGEEQKSLETAGRLYNELSDAKAERVTPILALGGGVIGDLAGFVAATYLRGVPLIQIPTTVLAQVDSSIGGKVAVDHGQLKNKVGAFYQPRLVVSDTSTLTTLTNDEVSDGLAEVIKYAVIRDASFFTYLEENLGKIIALDGSVLEEVVFRSAKIKAEVVEKDERDFGIRNTLNFGHTVGHAVETVSNFSVRHGQAVAIGMVAAGRISNQLGLFSKGEQIRLKQLIQKAGLPVEVPALDMREIVQAMRHDKKVSEGKIRFILPKGIGDVLISDKVTLPLIEQALVANNEQT